LSKKKYADTYAVIVTGTHTTALAGGQCGYPSLLPSLPTVPVGVGRGRRHRGSRGHLEACALSSLAPRSMQHLSLCTLVFFQVPAEGSPKEQEHSSTEPLQVSLQMPDLSMVP